MARSFPQQSEFELDSFTSSYFSNGIIPRLRGIIEAHRFRGAINHVTGDVHYLVLGLPGRKTLLTVHDCGFMAHPNPLARKVLKWFWLDLPVRHCRYVTAVSEATKRDIIHYTGCSPGKVVVVPTVISDGFHRSERAFNAECPRILHSGLAHNKNFARHVEAIAGIKCHFHIIGKLDASHVGLLEKHGIWSTSEYNISQADIQRTFAESDLLLFASTLEGFGMPVLEAQSVGRPVITSNLSSMPEVAGSGACLVDPCNVESIREGLLKVIADGKYRDALVEKGFDNIKRFSAEAVARQYDALYAAIADA
jgi:glycosyltransferase involved in cell wall biosynthesis